MNELQNWFNNPDHDYAEGVALFAQHCKNKALVRYFQTGTARFRMAKLVYEMGKLAKTAAVEMAKKRPEKKPSAPYQTPLSHITNSNSMDLKWPKNVQNIPDIILAAKKEISTLYSVIDKKHRELYDLGTSNADDVVRKRKRILDDRKPAIDRADHLYQLKEEWFALEDGPARNRVANDIREMLAAPPEKQPTMVTPVETHGRVSLQTAVSGLSDLDLSKRRSALRSSITKTQNMLQYQTIRKGESPTPMPPGPKRDEYQKKLKTLQKEYNAVVAELERRSK